MNIYKKTFTGELYLNLITFIAGLGSINAFTELITGSNKRVYNRRLVSRMRLPFVLFLFFSSTVLFAQNFNGQWRGAFVDNSTAFVGFGGQKIDYVLELEAKGSNVTGYSYTYFSEGDKRFYTICKVKGTLNRGTKELVISEFERTKFNTPPDFRNCFQTHKLRYIKDNPEEESLQGTWIPAPSQEGDCGFGKTTLTRKIVKPLSLSTRSRNTSPVDTKKEFRDLNREQKPPIVSKPKTVTKDTKKLPITPPKEVAKNNDRIATGTDKKMTIPKDTVVTKVPVVTEIPVKKKEQDIPLITGKYEKRNNNLLQTINIKNPTFTVDFYDDGTIDGDSISVFYNGKLILSHQRLTDKPISLMLTLDPDKKINELVMYAENLGEIPPNTALMIVHDADARYEARLVSDTQQNASVRFTYAPR